MIYSVILTLGLIYTDQIVDVFAHGFDDDTSILAVNLTRITLFGMYVTGLIHVIRAYLQLQQRYQVPELSLVPMNIITMISFSAAYYIDILIWRLGG